MLCGEYCIFLYFCFTLWPLFQNDNAIYAQFYNGILLSMQTNNLPYQQLMNIFNFQKTTIKFNYPFPASVWGPTLSFQWDMDPLQACFENENYPTKLLDAVTAFNSMNFE